MAVERRPEKFFHTEFINMMHAEYAPSEKSKLSTEIGGFTGAIGQQIAELQAEGLGRTIGVPAKSKDPRTLGAYQEIMYALPLSVESESGDDKRFLLISPHDNGYDLAIVSPLKTEGRNKQREDERTLKRFDTIFSPSELPFIFSGSWDQEEGVRTIKMFVDRQKQFSAQYQSVPNTVSYEEIVEKAISTAREKKQPKEDEVIMLRDIFNGSDFGEQEAA